MALIYILFIQNHIDQAAISFNSKGNPLGIKFKSRAIFNLRIVLSKMSNSIISIHCLRSYLFRINLMIWIMSNYNNYNKKQMKIIIIII